MSETSRSQIQLDKQLAAAIYQEGVNFDTFLNCVIYLCAPR